MIVNTHLNGINAQFEDGFTFLPNNTDSTEFFFE